MNRYVFVTMVVLTITSSIWANDVYAPAWRGANLTVTATWDAWNANGSPDLWSSVPGMASSPTATIDPGGNGSAALLGSYGGRTNVVKLGENGDIKLIMPNFGSGTSLKMMLQVTYYSDLTHNLVFAPGFTGSSVSVDSTLITTHGSGWVTEGFGLTYTPATSYESFSLWSYQGVNSYYPAYIDSIIVDTQLIPEPATLVLTAVGIMIVRRFTQKKISES